MDTLDIIPIFVPNTKDESFEICEASPTIFDHVPTLEDVEIETRDLSFVDCADAETPVVSLTNCDEHTASADDAKLGQKSVSLVI